jgi:creatinine amidohydrolase
MRIAEMSWMQVERWLARDDRAVLPVGSTEQHAHLSLATDSLLAERVACEAAGPSGVPVFPAIAYGITPYFRAYPGTVSLRIETFFAVLRDALDSLAASGFRRVVIVNGHGGNAPGATLAAEWMADHPGTRVKFHNWWNAPRTIARVREIDPVASHASWMESFPWTRVPGGEAPSEPKPMAELARLPRLSPEEVREMLGDGNFGGRYQRADEEMLSIWKVAVEETRELIEAGWE